MITFEPPFFVVAGAVAVLFLFAGAGFVGILRNIADDNEQLIGRWFLVLFPSILGLTAILLLMKQGNLCVGTP